MIPFRFQKDPPQNVMDDILSATKIEIEIETKKKGRKEREKHRGQCEDGDFYFAGLRGWEES